MCIGNISTENQLLCKHYGKVLYFDKSFQGNFLTFTLDNNTGLSLSTLDIC